MAQQFIWSIRNGTTKSLRSFIFRHYDSELAFSWLHVFGGGVCVLLDAFWWIRRAPEGSVVVTGVVVL